MFSNSNDNIVSMTAQTIRSTAHMLAGRLLAMGGVLGSRMATKQIAAGEVAYNVYLATQLGSRKHAIEAMRLMNEYSQQIGKQELAHAGGAYQWHHGAEDEAKLSLSNLANQQFINQESGKPLGEILQTLKSLFESFNQFLGR